MECTRRGKYRLLDKSKLNPPRASAQLIKFRILEKPITNFLGTSFDRAFSSSFPFSPSLRILCYPNSIKPLGANDGRGDDNGADGSLRRIIREAYPIAGRQRIAILHEIGEIGLGVEVER